MNKDQNLINEFAIKTLKENLNVMYAQIWREGQLTAEYKRMPVKTRLNTWSACKGVVSCAAGIALDEGLIRLDEKIVDIFPEYAPENPEGYLGDVTLENMLTMTTGLESSLFFCDWPERYTTPDWIRYFFENAKVIKKPGTEWLYSNFNTYMISCAIEKRAGVNLLEYLRNRFFEPLGIGNPDWTLCPKGHVHQQPQRYGKSPGNPGKVQAGRKNGSLFQPCIWQDPAGGDRGFPYGKKAQRCKASDPAS